MGLCHNTEVKSSLILNCETNSPIWLTNFFFSCFRFLSFQQLLKANVTRTTVLCSSLYEEAFHATLKLAVQHELIVNTVTLFWGRKLGFNKINYTRTSTGLETFVQQAFKEPDSTVPSFLNDRFLLSRVKVWFMPPLFIRKCFLLYALRRYRNTHVLYSGIVVSNQPAG